MLAALRQNEKHRTIRAYPKWFGAIFFIKGGSRQSKSYGLRFGWISPQATSRCQLAVSHYGLCRVVTDSGTELPLSPYCNPLPAQLRQPRWFPRQLPVLLASFAGRVSQANTGNVMAVTYTRGCLIHPAHARQATLHTASLQSCCIRTALQVLSCPVEHPSIRRCIGVPQQQVSTETGSWFHAIERCPETLTPSIHPKLGVRSKHQGLHRYARLRIFRPVLGARKTD